jgi:hypothetical protein
MSDADIIGKEEMQEWRANPITKRLLKMILSERLGVLNGLETGVFLDMSNPYITHANVARAWGQVEGLNAIVDMMQEKKDEV